MACPESRSIQRSWLWICRRMYAAIILVTTTLMIMWIYSWQEYIFCFWNPIPPLQKIFPPHFFVPFFKRTNFSLYLPNNAFYTLSSELHILHSILQISHFTLYSPNYTFFTVSSKLHILHSTLQTTHFTLYSTCSLISLKCIFYEHSTVSTPCTV